VDFFAAWESTLNGARLVTLGGDWRAGIHAMVSRTKKITGKANFLRKTYRFDAYIDSTHGK
jgi:hypothetical protein